MNETLEKTADRAEEIFRGGIEKELLSQGQGGLFVAVEPDSGDYFLGKTISEANRASRAKYPGRLIHTFRVGHRAAVHVGGVSP